MNPSPYYSSGRPELPQGSWLIAALLGLAAAAFHAAHGMQLANSVLMQSFNWVFDFDSSRFIGAWCTPGADVARDFDIAFVPRHALALSMRPLCMALQPLTADPGVALMLLTAACAGAVVATAYALAASFCEAEFDRIVLALGFGLSAQPLMLGVIPETFCFALLGIGVHLAMLARLRGAGPLLGLPGAVSLFLNLGFTVTNAGLNLVSAAVLGWQRMPWPRWLAQQGRVWLLAGGALLALTLLAAWVYAPSLLGLAGTAPQRVWWIININRGEPASLLMVLCTFTLYSFVAPALSTINLAPDEPHLMLDFRTFSYGWTGGLALALWCATMAASVWLAWRGRDTRRLLLVVGIWMLFNLALHGYWQYRGSVYLYGAHTAFPLFAVLCMGYGGALQHYSPPLVRGVAISLVVLNAINNYGPYGSIAEFLLRHSAST